MCRDVARVSDLLERASRRPAAESVGLDAFLRRIRDALRPAFDRFIASSGP